MSSIPVYLLTGYLGSGKTTALNHLLSQDTRRDQDGMGEKESRTALIINEFGTLGVDGQVISAQENRVFEINRGSLFCACTKTEFLQTLDIIARKHKPGTVIAEATGVGETSDLFEIFSLPHIRDQFHIRANVCLVDAINFTKILPYLKAAQAQVRLADGVVINKVDLLEKEETSRLSALISEMNPAAPQACVRQGQVNWDFIQRLTHQSFRAAAPVLPPNDVSVCSIAGDWADRDRLQAAINDLGSRLLRLKGVVNFGGGQVLVESVFGSCQETRVGDLVSSTGITAIGWKIGREELSGILSPCIRSTDNLVSL